MKKSLGSALILLALSATTANAAVVVLNFAGLNGLGYEGVGDYYNGGAGSLGSTGGANYGISFGSDAIVGKPQPSGNINSAMVPGGAGAQALFFLTGPGDLMNVASGFNTGFSFYYSAPIHPGNVTVWSGLNGTGTLLETIALGLTTDGINVAGCEGTNYCPYAAAGGSFTGSAESVLFSGTTNYIAFADVTFGSATPAPVPIPAAIWMFASGLVGLGAFRKKFQVQSNMSAIA